MCVGNIFDTVKINMAAKPEVLIPSQLLQIETSFRSQNVVTKLAACMRPRPTADDTIVCWIFNNRKWW